VYNSFLIIGGYLLRYIKCKVCKEEKIETEFYRDSNRYTGFMNRCKVCDGVKNKNRMKTRKRTDPLYRIWIGIKRRCYLKSSTNYNRYGGRGIKVCEEWKSDSAAFKNWCLQNGYKEGLQIDRIDNDGDYSPDNCRFVTNQENSQNTSRTKLNPDLVRQLRGLRDMGATYVELERTFGINRASIRSCCVGMTWTNVD